MNTQSIKPKYITKQKLSDDEITSIHEFEEIINRDKYIFYKIDPQGLNSDNARTKHILSYKNNVLCSYAYINSFDGEVLECTILSTGSKNELNALYEIILQNAKLMGVKKILLIIDNNDTNFIDFVKNLGLQYSFSEYRMFLENDRFEFNDKGIISLQNASIDDKRLILELDEALSDDDLVNVQLDEADLLSTKIAKKGNDIVGKIRVDKVGDIAGIYGFVVRAIFRGKGLGREILTSVVNGCLIEGYKKIYLEVESENRLALHLYESVGFKIRATFDYFEVKLNDD